MKLARRFYERPAEVVAEELIGKILVRRIAGQNLRARVVETEAYVGVHDLACHAAKGRTRRTEIMFGHGGFAYVYFIYGMHAMLNVVTGKNGVAEAVLIRAAEPLDPSEKLSSLSGPGRLAKAMRITVAENGTDLTGDEIWFESAGGKAPPVARTVRIGVDYAGKWRDEPLRFIALKSAALSGPRRLNQAPVDAAPSTGRRN